MIISMREKVIVFIYLFIKTFGGHDIGWRLKKRLNLVCDAHVSAYLTNLVNYWKCKLFLKSSTMLKCL